jgi:hypothetical protein
VRRSDGRQTVHDAGRGDVLLIPKGAAHSFALHTPEVQVLFVTPREGNTTWSDTTEGAIHAITERLAGASRTGYRRRSWTRGPAARNTPSNHDGGLS